MQDIQIQPKQHRRMIWNFSLMGFVSFALNLVYFAFENVIRNLIANLVMPLALRSQVSLSTPLYVEGVADIAMLSLIPILLFVLVYLIGRGFNAARISYTSLSAVLLATGIIGAEIGWSVQYFLLFQYSVEVCNVPFCPLSPVLNNANVVLVLLAIPAGIYTVFVGLSALVIGNLTTRSRKMLPRA